MSFLNDIENFLCDGNLEFAPFFRERIHIWVEQRDLKKDIKSVQNWIDGSTETKESEKKKRLDFVRSHISRTAGCFTWYFKESSFS